MVIDHCYPALCTSEVGDRDPRSQCMMKARCPTVEGLSGDECEIISQEISSIKWRNQVLEETDSNTTRAAHTPFLGVRQSE